MPCVIGKLPEDQYYTIMTNYTNLIEDIKHDPVGLARSLFQTRVFNDDDVEIIKREERSVQGSKKDAAAKLLDIVLNSGDQAYGKFIDALKENGYSGCVRRLISSFGGNGSNEPDIITDNELFTGSQDCFYRLTKPQFGDSFKAHNDLFGKRSADSPRLGTMKGKRSADSPRLRTMKGEALTYLEYVKEKKYVETRALGEGLKILKNQHILGIIGAAGDGKSILSMMIANHFIEEHSEYKPLLIYDIDDIKEVNFEDDKYLYIIDDMYGKFNKLQARIDKWPSQFGTLRINKERGNLVIIYVMRDYIYLSSKYQLDTCDIFVDNIEITTQIFLHKSNLSLNAEEKKHFLDFYRVNSDKIISKISDCFGFPSIVSLCSKLPNNKLPADLDGPHSFLLLQLEMFWEENRYIYATLLLVFCLHTVSEKGLKQKSPAGMRSLILTIKNVCEKFELEVAKSKLYELSDTFIKYIEENYTKIFSLRDFVEAPFLHHLSDKNMEMALQYCSLELLMALVRTNDQDDRCIIIGDIFYDDLAMRCIKELQDKNVDIVSHPAFIDYAFLSRFLGMNGIANLLHDAKCINLGNIREIQESGNFLHYITLHGDMRCLEAVLFYFQDQLPQLIEEKTDMGWDIIGLAAVSTHNPFEKINLLKEKKIGDFLTLPHLAVYSDKFDIVEYICNFTNIGNSKRDFRSRTVLHNACDSKHDNRQIIDFLIGMEFDVNAQDESGSTPLHLAVTRGKPQTVSILINSGAEVNVKDNRGRLPIHNISSSFGGRTNVGASHILNQLIQAGSLLHEADNHSRIPLLEIIANVDRTCFNLIINTGLSSHTLDMYTQAIILESSKLQDVSMFRYILDSLNEIDINHFDKSILFECCSSADKMRILHNKGMDFNVVDDLGRSILHYSCRHGSIDTVRYLLTEMGLKNLNQKDKNGYTSAFYSAVSDIDSVKKLKFLLSEGCSLHVVDAEHRSLLHVCCKWGMFQTVKYLINEIGLGVNRKDNEGRSPAMFCAMSDENPISKLKFLSSKEVSLHELGKNGLSLLQVSCKLGTMETVEYLVNDIGLDVNHKDNESGTPVICCSISNVNPVSKLKFLVSKGASLHVVDNNNESLLHASCQRGTIETVEYLVNEIGLDVNRTDNEGWTPALYCARSDVNPLTKLKFLSSKGASLHAVNKNNVSLLHVSCLDGTVETVEYLVNEIGLDAKFEANKGWTPAKCCSVSNINPIKKLKFLSSKGVSLHIVDDNNASLLHVSCEEGTFETIEYLVNEIGLDVYHKDNKGGIPALYCSISNINPIKKLKFLSSKGVSLHAVDNDTFSLLHISCQLGSIETVEYLVNEIGLDIYLKDNKGGTPALYCSISNINPIKKLKFLLSKGISLHAMDNNIISLLHASCQMGTIETVEYLVNEMGLDVNSKDSGGHTPAMHCFVFNINPIKKLKFLSSKGASLHVVDNDNESLLHVSCQMGTIETVEYLVNEIGLDVYHKDNKGWTPAMYCSISNINPIKKLKFLSSKGASLHVVDNDNGSLLHASCQMGTIETVEYLVNKIGLDVNHKNNDGLTPAIASSWSNINPFQKIKFLSSKGVNLHDSDDCLFYESCLCGTFETVEFLVNECGLDVNQRDDKGLTPAMFCCHSNISPVKKLRFFSSKGASLHKVENVLSLLHISCRVGTIETVEYLVNEVGLDVNQLYYNDTPLLWCVLSEFPNMEKIRFLISKGAMIKICRPYKDFFKVEDD